MKKRILALVLCLTLVVGMAPTVYAQERQLPADGVEVTAQPDVPAPTEKPGEPTPAPTEEPAITETPAPTQEPAETKTPESTEAPVDPTPIPRCDCGSQDGVHAETCPLYIAPTKAPVPAVDADALRTSLLSLESEAAVYAFLEGLSEEEYQALASVVTEDDILALTERCGISLEEVVITPPKNYTEVGPLAPPVTIAGRSARAMLRAAAEEKENGLILNKQAQYDKLRNLVHITLEAYTTGTVTTYEQAVPSDIVLVLDESASLAHPLYQYVEVYSLNKSSTYYVKSGNSYTEVKWCAPALWGHAPGWYTGSCIPIINSHQGTLYEPRTSASDTASGREQFYAPGPSKQSALKAGAADFVQAIYEDARENNVDHRVSVIGFSSKGSSKIKIGLSGDIRNNMGDRSDPKSGTVLYAINELSANGGTYIEDGLSNAKKAFDNAAPTSATTRSRVVIVFTDGIPGTGTWNDTTIKDSANPSIAESMLLKNAYGATVYTIGMLENADPELPIANNTSDTARINKFLHYLSSNYPNAASMNDGGTGGENKGYYLSAGDTESLSRIFDKISKEIATPAIDLGTDTIIKDVVSQYFKTPIDENTVTVKTYDCISFNGANGEAAWSDSGTALNATIAVTGDTINVTGFNFTQNFVSEKAKPGTAQDHGKKVVITFSSELKDGFWGGEGVPTNEGTSGVYKKDDTLLEPFEVPQVTVPLNVPDFMGNTVNVYYGGSSPQASALYTPLKKPTGSDAWKAEFVTLGEYTVSGMPAVMTQDGQYTVSMTAFSGQETQTKTAAANVHIFLPQFTVTAQDLWTDYGVSVPLTQWGLVQENGAPKAGVTWMREGTAADQIAMSNPKPNVSDYRFTFAPAGTSGEILNSTYTTNELDADFTVGLASCKVGGIEYAVPKGALTVTKAVADESHDFTVHINKFKVTINKTFGGADTYRQDCIFTVTSGGASFQVVIPAEDGRKTVVGLVCGKEYKITEAGSWSWRYKESAPHTVTCTTKQISNTQPTEAFVNGGAVGIDNTLNNVRWLSGKDVISNLFPAKARRRADREEE
jgi:hypothetical protein